MHEQPALIGISPVQQVYIDAVVASANMIEVAHDRLESRLTTDAGDERTKAETLSDAWTIVDNSYRLNSLLRQFPGLKQRSDDVRDALRVFKSAEPFRHAVQHMDREIRSTAAAGGAVWGEIYWATKEPGGTIRNHLRLRTPYAGSGREWTLPAAPPDTDFSRGASFIHLVLADRTINLSQIAHTASVFGSRFIGELTTAYSNRPGEPEETLRLFLPDT